MFLHFHHQASAQISSAAATGWKSASEAATLAAEYTAEGVHKLSATFAADGTEQETPPSAMDSATRGGPVTL